MTCPHDFQKWSHADLAQLAHDLYIEVQSLRYDLDMHRRMLSLCVAAPAVTSIKDGEPVRIVEVDPCA